MCNICGQPDYIRCNCVSTQPFCDQCESNSVCVEKVDSSCVIYHFKSQQPSGLVNLNLPNGSSVEAILEAIDDLIANGLNITFSGQNSQSIAWTPGGSAGHAPSASVIISSDADNQLTQRANGLFASKFNPNYLVKVSSAFAPGYLENKLVGDADPLGIIGVTMINNAGVLQATPSINLVNLLSNFLDVSDTNSVDLAIAAGTPNVLSANVKISLTPGNSITLNPDGLYAAGGALDTVDNGLTETAGNVQLGGPLVQDTLISDYDFNMNFQTKTVQIGNLIVPGFNQPVGFTNDEGRKFTIRNRSPYFGSGADTSNIYADYILEDVADVTLNSHASHGLNAGILAHFKDTVTFTKDTQHAGIGAGLGLGTDNTAIVNTGNPIAAIRSTVFLISGSAVGEPDSILQGTINQAASFYAGIPSKGVASDPDAQLPDINNYYGLYIDDPALGSISAKIGNPWGVYQVGAASVNRFFGAVQNSGGGLEFTSDERIKENIQPLQIGLDTLNKVEVVKYDYKEFTGNPKKGVLGVIAQQLETVFPEAVSTTNMYDIDDFKMVNESYLLYAMINAIKELSAKVNALENK